MKEYFKWRNKQCVGIIHKIGAYNKTETCKNAKRRCKYRTLFIAREIWVLKVFESSQRAKQKLLEYKIKI